MTYRDRFHLMGKTMNTTLASIAALGLALALGNDAQAGAAATAPGRGNWVTAWYAAPQPGWDKAFILPMNVPSIIGGLSVEETVRLSSGGRRVRLVFSNRHGREALALADVRVRLVGQAGRASPAIPLTFSGLSTLSIAAGATAISDPVALNLPPLARLRVTSHVPLRTAVTSFHWGGQQTFVLGGKADARGHAGAGRRFGGRLFLAAVLVDGKPAARTVVALGDSITDGNGSTPDADHRWPDFLARRLAPHGLAVANAGISGGRLLRDGMGRSALARFDQDVLAQPGVSDVIVLLGTNDIGWPGGPFAPQEAPAKLGELQAGFRQLAAAAHARGLRITVGTLPPFEGALEGTPFAGHYSPDKERLRRQLNDWLRTADAFDAVVDFDHALRDPGHPPRLRADFDSGDHLHPGDAGYRAMAEAIDIDLLLRSADGARHPRASAP